VQREGALITERIEHAPAMTVFRHGRMLKALVEIETRFLSALKIQPIFQSLNFQPFRLAVFAGPRVHFEGQTLESTNRCVVPENYLCRFQDVCQRIANQRGAFFHRDGLDLNDQYVAKLIDDYAGQIIRFAPD
jgi:hypothetical protein